jgi:hypothetical protein
VYSYHRHHQRRSSSLEQPESVTLSVPVPSPPGPLAPAPYMVDTPPSPVVYYSGTSPGSHSSSMETSVLDQANSCQPIGTLEAWLFTKGTAAKTPSSRASTAATPSPRYPVAATPCREHRRQHHITQASGSGKRRRLARQLL